MATIVNCRECGWSAELDDSFENGHAACPVCGSQRLDSRVEPRKPFAVLEPDSLETLITAMYRDVGDVPESDQRTEWATAELREMGLSDECAASMLTALVYQMAEYERANYAELMDLVRDPDIEREAEYLAEKHGRDPQYISMTREGWREVAAS